LNVTLYNLTFWLDESWNFQTGTSSLQAKDNFNLLNDLDINIHFVTKNKPWLTYSIDFNSSLYYLLFQSLELSHLYDKAILSSKSGNTRKMRFASYLLFYHQIKTSISKRKNKPVSSTSVIAYYTWVINHKIYLKKNRAQIQSLWNKWEERVNNSLMY